jgi:thiosulfate reductase cytochrome b subunit
MDADPQVTLRPKHPFWIRWAHWINFPLLAVMLFSGVLIYWANDIYTPFIPKSWYRALGWNQRLAEGMALHFAVAWVFVINGVLYGLYLAISGEWRELMPTRSTFRDAFLVLLHDLRLRRELPPQGKFNAAQRIAYSSILALGVVAAASGLAIYKPVQLGWLRVIFGGYEGARLVHFLVAVGFIAFFLIHIAQVIRAGWNNFQAMVTGWEVEHDHEHR